jgi:hypothetical protein
MCPRPVRTRLTSFRNSIGLLLVLLSTACSGMTGVKQCGPEERRGQATGQISLTEPNSIALGGITLGESREPGRPETEEAGFDMYAQNYTNTFLSSDFLRGHLTKIEIRDSQSPSRLLGAYAVPADVLQLLPPNLFHITQPYTWPVSVEQALTMLVSGQLIMQLETDLPSQPLVIIPLTRVFETDLTWHRATGEICG